MDTIEPQAEAIPQTGEAEWFPQAEDDAAAAPGRGPQMGIRWVFYGADGLRAGWSILLLAGCCSMYLALRHGRRNNFRLW